VAINCFKSVCIDVSQYIFPYPRASILQYVTFSVKMQARNLYHPILKTFKSKRPLFAISSSNEERMGDVDWFLLGGRHVVRNLLRSIVETISGYNSFRISPISMHILVIPAWVQAVSRDKQPVQLLICFCKAKESKHSLIFCQ